MRDRKFNITKAEEGAAFGVHVVPKATRNEILGKHGLAQSRFAPHYASDLAVPFLEGEVSMARGGLPEIGHLAFQPEVPQAGIRLQ